MAATELAESLNKRVDLKILDRHTRVITPVKLGQPSEPIMHQDANARPLTVRGDRREALAESTMRLKEGATLEVRSIRHNTIRWSTELRLLGEQAIDTMQSELIVAQSGYAPYPIGFDRVGRAVVDGQTLVVNTEYGLHAVGLLTGRRLWSRRYWPPQGSGRSSGSTASDAWLWAHNGRVVSVDARGCIEVAPIDDGERVLWRAKRPKRGWYFVRVRGDYVILADRELEHVDVFRMADGRYMGQCEFTQSQARRVSISLFDDVICGPTAAGTITAMDLKAPGIERWQVAMPDALSQVFKPTPNLLGVADRSGHLRIIDPGTGKQIVESNVTSCPAGVTDGVVQGNRLYVFGYQQRANEPAKTISDQIVSVAAIDMATGRELWGRNGLSAWTYADTSTLEASENAIVLVALEPPMQEKVHRMMRHHSGQPAELKMLLIDKQNGKTIGRDISVTLNESPMTRRILDVQAWPERVMIRAGALQIEIPCPVKAGEQVRTPKGNDERS
jgi:outer membrane protein assembly factor BamB